MIRLPLPVYNVPDAVPGVKPPDPQTPLPGTPSLLGTPAGDEQKPPAGAITALPDTWREIMAGTDAELATELKRFKTPEDFAKNALTLKKGMRQGSLDTEPMPADDKPEDQKKWREARGLPLDPTGYAISEPITKRLTDADKPILDNFIAAAHKKGISKSMVEFGAGWYADLQETQAAADAANDTKASSSAEDALRAEWGQSFRGNLEFAGKTALQLLGGDHGGSIFDARLPDGTKLGSIPGFVKGMLEVGRKLYGDGGLVDGADLKAGTDRITELENMIKLPDTYAKFKAEGLDKELEKLYERRDARRA